MIYNIKNKIRNLSHKNILVKKLYLLANKVKVSLLSGLSDEKFAKMKYKENTGKTLNLENPTTFNEKLWWLKLNNRDPLLTVCSDKYKVREYVEECGLEHTLTSLYGVYDNANDINFDELPERAFIKTNHGSGTNIIWDRNKPFNKDKFRKKFNKALKQNYYWQSREWNYKNIEPKIIVEEILEDKSGNLPTDYKFFCFNGEPKLLLVSENVCTNTGEHNDSDDRYTNVYDMNFNLLELTIKFRNEKKSKIKRPFNFEEMIKYAEILSKPFPHCRIDLYNIDGKIYFGEITFYHGGACHNINPVKWDRQMGDWIDLNSDKIKLRSR